MADGPRTRRATLPLLQELVEALAHALNNPVHMLTLSTPLLRSVIEDVRLTDAHAGAELGGLPAAEALTSCLDLLTQQANAATRISDTVQILRTYLVPRGAELQPDTVALDEALARACARYGAQGDVAVVEGGSALANRKVFGTPFAIEALIVDLLETVAATREAPCECAVSIIAGVDANNIVVLAKASGVAAPRPLRRALRAALRDLLVTDVGGTLSPVDEKPGQAIATLTLRAVAS